MKTFIKTLPNLMQYWDRVTSKLYKPQTEWAALEPEHQTECR
jgi:hypothetical protein